MYKGKSYRSGEKEKEGWPGGRCKCVSVAKKSHKACDCEQERGRRISAKDDCVKVCVSVCVKWGQEKAVCDRDIVYNEWRSVEGQTHTKEGREREVVCACNLSALRG